MGARSLGLSEAPYTTTAVNFDAPLLQGGRADRAASVRCSAFRNVHTWHSETFAVNSETFLCICETFAAWPETFLVEPRWR